MYLEASVRREGGRGGVGVRSEDVRREGERERERGREREGGSEGRMEGGGEREEPCL